MDLQLQGKIVIITGGSKGIGAGCTQAFAREGAIPVILGRSTDVGQQLLDDLEARGYPKGHAIKAELTDLDACQSAIDETLTKFGRIDGIIHNAGVNDGISLRHSPEEFLGSLHKNILHVFALTHYALDALIDSRGFLINISSKVADTGQGDTSGYAASKGAMNALTREWALSLAKHHIRVNTVVPAEVMTPLYQSWVSTLDDPEAFIAEAEGRIPFEHRMTTEAEIADTVAFLASPRSSHTTGQILYPDGGYVHLDRAYGQVNKK